MSSLKENSKIDMSKKDDKAPAFKSDHGLEKKKDDKSQTVSMERNMLKKEIGLLQQYGWTWREDAK